MTGSFFSRVINRESSEDFLRRYLVYFVSAISLIITPKLIFDPINIPKLILLCIFSFICLFVLIPYLMYYSRNGFKFLILLCLTLVFDLFLVIIFSGGNFAQQLYGAPGRGNGFFYYFSSIIIMLAFTFISDRALVIRFLVGLISLGGFGAIYGFLQSQGIDPAGFVSAYSPVIGFLGNPNFHASFLGLVLIAVVGVTIFWRRSILLTSLLISLIFLIFFGIQITRSSQGTLVGIIGIYVFLSLLLWYRKKPLGLISLFFGIAGVITGVFALFNKGPLASSLYQSSLEARGYYWEAAWNMTLSNPIFGVGLDNFMSWYRRSRSLEATQWLASQETNAAHNVFLDYSSNGGFPLLILNVVLMCFVLVTIVRKIRSMKSPDHLFLLIVSIWVGYFAQSLISINQIGLSIWGWSMAGIILGYRSEEQSLSPLPSQDRRKRGRKVIQSSSRYVLAYQVISGLSISLAVMLPMWNGNIKYRQALETGKVEVIQEAAYIRPFDLVRMVQSARVLRDNGFPEPALVISEDAVEAFPDSFIAWENLGSLSTLPPQRLVDVKIQLRRLDPLNPAFKD